MSRGEHGDSLFMLYPIGCSSRNTHLKRFYPAKAKMIGGVSLHHLHINQLGLT